MALAEVVMVLVARADHSLSKPVTVGITAVWMALAAAAAASTFSLAQAQPPSGLATVATVENGLPSLVREVTPRQDPPASEDRRSSALVKVVLPLAARRTVEQAASPKPRQAMAAPRWAALEDRADLS